MFVRKGPEPREPFRGKHFTEKRAKNCAAGSCEPKTGLTARQNRNVRCGVKEVVVIAERVNVWYTDNRRYRGTRCGVSA
jgi:hypothetical protein